jgi:hypothetical protein
MTLEQDVEATVREIRRKTRKKYSAEEKIRIVLEGLRENTALRNGMLLHCRTIDWLLSHESPEEISIVQERFLDGYIS